jgi:hypothetical protein
MSSSDEYDGPLDYPVLMADGIYTNFREGFVSLMFYQQKSIPKITSETKMNVTHKKEIVADMRVPNRMILDFIDSFTGGLEGQSIIKKHQETLNYFGKIHDRSIDQVEGYEENKIMNPLHNYLLTDELQSMVTPEGQEELKRLVYGLTTDFQDKSRDILHRFKKIDADE